MTFSASGTFSSTGIKTDHLAGNGTPILGGTLIFQYLVHLPGTFPITVTGLQRLTGNLHKVRQHTRGQLMMHSCSRCHPGANVFHYVGSNTDETFIFSLVDIQGGN
jgi:hypothetical protein